MIFMFYPSELDAEGILSSSLPLFYPRMEPTRDDDDDPVDTSAADQAYSFTYCHGGTGATTIAELLRDADVLVAVKTYHSVR